MPRVFVGIPVRSLAGDVETVRRMFRDFPVRWLELKDLHVTLVPPWQTNNVDEAIEMLRHVRGEKCTLEFDKVSLGPPKNKRLVWATGSTPPQIPSLARFCATVLDQQLETRKFLLHATLARFSPATYKRFPAQEINHEVNWVVPVDKFALYESVPSIAGSTYNVIEEFAL